MFNKNEKWSYSKKIHYIIFLIRVRDAKDKFDLEGILYKNVGVYFFIIYKGIPT